MHDRGLLDYDCLLVTLKGHLVFRLRSRAQRLPLGYDITEQLSAFSLTDD
ncbi:MAG: hypothetical protein ACI9SP_004291 [Arenicella sp.]|jgi:hypothetical protein